VKQIYGNESDRGNRRDDIEVSHLYISLTLMAKTAGEAFDRGAGIIKLKSHLNRVFRRRRI
jgi:hypothetical protein